MSLTIWLCVFFGFMGFEGEGPPKPFQDRLESKDNVTSHEFQSDWGYGVNDSDVSSDEEMFPSSQTCGPDHGSLEHENALLDDLARICRPLKRNRGKDEVSDSEDPDVQTLKRVTIAATKAIDTRMAFTVARNLSMATHAATKAIDVVMRAKKSKIADPNVICSSDITEHGIATVNDRTYGPRSKQYDSSKPTASFNLTLNNGQCGWIAQSDLKYDSSMLAQIVKLHKSQKKSKNNQQSHFLRTAEQRSAENALRTPEKRRPENKASNALRTPEQRRASNASTNPRNHAINNPLRTADQRRAENTTDHAPAVSALHARIESSIHNWPNHILQPVIDDVEFQSFLNGNIENRCAQRFQQEINHTHLLKVPCSVCWELRFKRLTTDWDITSPALKEMFAVLTAQGQWAAQAIFDFVAPFDVFNSIHLLDKAMHPDNFTITVCKQCSNHMQHDKVPPTAVANKLYFGERSETMKNMSIPMKLLTCPVRQKAFIIKLKGYGNPKSMQRGVKGTTIAYPQDNALVDLNGELPHRLDELARSLDIVFVGSTEPTEEQLKKIFKVSSADVLTVLQEWKQNGHPAFQHGTWNVDELEQFEASGQSMTELLRHCISRTDEEGEAILDQATQSYTNDENNDDHKSDPNSASSSFVPSSSDVDDEKEPDENHISDTIILDRCGMVNSNSVGEDRAALAKSAAEAIRVGHHEDPVNTYGNPEYWVNSMPWLFPNGTGGAELDRPTDLSLTDWVKHCLNFHDDRFRKDPAFLFVVYKCLQIRDRVSKTRILSKIFFSTDSHKAINAISSADLQKILDIFTETSTLFGSNTAEVKRIRELIKHLKIIGKHSRDSVYAREAARGKMMGLVTLYGLPNIFVTINLSDISNPIVSFWNQTMETSFNLDDLMPDFPNKAARAQMVADDPVHAAQMFHTVIEAFLKAFLGYELRTDDTSGITPSHMFIFLDLHLFAQTDSCIYDALHTMVYHQLHQTH